MKMLINLEAHHIIGSNFAYLYIFFHCRDTGMQNGNMALPWISPAGRGQMLITLEPHDILYFDHFFFYLNRLALFGMYILAEALQNFTSDPFYKHSKNS